MRPFASHKWTRLTKTGRKTITSASPLITPVAYLAAPFSGRDTDDADPGIQDYLFEFAPSHGIIPRAGFRNGLLGIERALIKLGLSVLIPHRDVNEWGRKQLTPIEAMRDCTNHVSKSDLFVGILGSSCGAHYEFGIAHASGKPCILIEVAELSGSFLAKGLEALKSDDLIFLKCQQLKEAEGLISTSSEVQQFVKRHLGSGVVLS
ncbi:MAG: hypothetical protein IPJ30_15230 [Acidobacteria bacterium]|nr:hypothetical protein [Acidobacteriota bacterium]